MKLINGKLHEPLKEENLYFKLLKEDRLEMFEVYLGLVR